MSKTVGALATMSIALSVGLGVAASGGRGFWQEAAKPTNLDLFEVQLNSTYRQECAYSDKNCVSVFFLAKPPDTMTLILSVHPETTATIVSFSEQLFTKIVEQNREQRYGKQGRVEIVRTVRHLIPHE